MSLKNVLRISLEEAVLMDPANERLYEILDSIERRRQAELVGDARVQAGTHREIVDRLGNSRVKRVHKESLPLCGARCRDGHPCRARVFVRSDGSSALRCRMHGGLSTGPKTQAGRDAVAASNHRRQRNFTMQK